MYPSFSKSTLWFSFFYSIRFIFKATGLKSFIKTVFNLSQKVYKELIFVFFLASTLSFAEAFLLVNVVSVYDFLIKSGLSQLQSQSLMIFVYTIIVLLGLLMVFVSRYLAFRLSFSLCIDKSLPSNSLDFVRQESALNNLMTIERERLAREILTPLLTIVSKISLPIFAIYLILTNVSFSSLSLIVGLFAVFAVFGLASTLFSRFAIELELILARMSERLTEFTNTFTSLARLDKFDYSQLSNENYKLSIVEGKIDFISQFPRQAIDIAVLGAILFSVTNDSEQGIYSFLISAPLALRGISYFQALYKAYASLKSNIMALSVTSLGLKSKNDGKTTFLTKHTVSLKYESKTGCLIDTETGSAFKAIGLKYPSGYGKSNAIVNFLYQTSLFPSKLKFNIANLDPELIGYIPAEPYFSYRPNIGNDGFNFPEKFIPSQTSPILASAGEKFRWALISELKRGIRVLIIDESIVSIQKNQRLEVFKICSELKVPVSLIIISHSDDVLAMCDTCYTAVD